MSAGLVLRVPEDFLPQDTDVRLQASKPLPEVIEELEALEAADRAAEQTRARLKPWLWGIGIGFFLGFVFVVPLILGIPFVILLYKYMQTGKRDVEDRRLDVARHLLSSLQDEVDPKANVVLEMDFRGYAKGQARRQDGLQHYTQPWMRMGLVLRNGGALQITATTHCKRKSKRKRKYTKHKDKLVEELGLEIRAPKGRPLAAAEQNRVAQALATPLPAARLLRCRVRPRVAELVFRTEAAVRTTPRPSFVNRQAMLDAEKVLTLTTLGYRAATRSTTA